MLEMTTDMGTEYKNKTIEEIFKHLNITHNTSIAYHHEIVGLIERSHRTLNEYLRSYISSDKTDWYEFIYYFIHEFPILPI